MGLSESAGLPKGSGGAPDSRRIMFQPRRMALPAGGKDRLFGRGGADRVDCGPGLDRVAKDRSDRVANCEVIG